MCIPVAVWWDCCTTKEEAFVFCGPGSDEGAVGYSCRSLTPLIWPTTTEHLELARQRQSIVKPAWCCSPSCCLRAIENPKPNATQLKAYVELVQWHRFNCFPRFSEGLSRRRGIDAEPKRYVKAAIHPQLCAEFNQALGKCIENMNTYRHANQSPYCHFVNVRNYILLHPGTSQRNHPVDMALASAAMIGSNSGLPFEGQFAKGTSTLSTFPNLPSKESRDGQQSSSSTHATPRSSTDNVPTSVYLDSLDATLLEIIAYIHASTFLLTQSTTMTVDGDRSDSVWHLLPQDTNTSATAVNADRTDRLARPERIWVEAAHNLNFWRTEIGSLANTAIQKDHRKNPGGIFNELPFQWLNNLVDKELKLTKSIMLFVEVVNAWFERRSEEERRRLTEWVEGLSPLGFVDVPGIV